MPSSMQAQALASANPFAAARAHFDRIVDRLSSTQMLTRHLVISVSLQETLECLEDEEDPDETDPEDDLGPWIDIAPDVVHKANVSGAGPVAMSGAAPRFDSVLVGQAGSLTLLSYLRVAFDWGGFPGFEYIADAPTELIEELRRDLTRL